MRLILITAALLAGCVTARDIPSRLYDIDGGIVMDASFYWSGGYSGPATITKTDEACRGEYQTIRLGSTTVGQGSTTITGPASVWGTIFNSLYASTTVEHAQRGYAVAICPSGEAFECEYITNVSFSGVSGHGACRSNRGRKYRLMFS